VSIVARILLGIVLLAVVVVAGHLVLIEAGREVVVLRTHDAEGRTKSTRLWCVDEGDSVWLHSAGADWLPRFAGDGIVELERNGSTRRYRAEPMPGAHPRVHALLREKYGVADRWVRFVGGEEGADVVAVRLDPVD
jgi:hypothetical protein